MKKQFAITLPFLLCAITMFAASTPYNMWWEKGNRFYQQKQYDSAAYFYEQIAALKPQNAEVYYNLGTTYYRLNKIGPAVLNFERALRLNPDYKEASENLALTQSRISNHIAKGQDIFFITWWQSITNSRKATTWAVLSLIVFLLVIGSLAFKRFNKSKPLPPQLIGILSFVWVIFLLLAFVSSQNATTSIDAVIMQDNAPLMNNDQKGKPQSLLPEGTKVELVNEKTGWAEVRLADGRRGWIQQSLFTRI